MKERHHFASIAVTGTDGRTAVYAEDEHYAYAFDVQDGGSLAVLRRTKDVEHDHHTRGFNPGWGEPEVFAGYARGCWASATYDV